MLYNEVFIAEFQVPPLHSLKGVYYAVDLVFKPLEGSNKLIRTLIPDSFTFNHRAVDLNINDDNYRRSAYDSKLTAK